MASCQGNGSATFPVPGLICSQPELELGDTYNDKRLGFDKLLTTMHLNALPDDVIILIMTHPLSFCPTNLQIIGLLHIDILLKV